MLAVTAIAACDDRPPSEISEPGYPALRPAPCELERTSFRIDRLEHPSTLAALHDVAPSVDRDPAARPDAAMTIAVLQARSALGLDLGPALETMIAEGTIDWTLHVETCVDGGDHARVIAEESGRESMIASVGTIADGRVAAFDGTALIPAPALFATTARDDLVWVPASGIAVRFETQPDGSIQGAIGGGVSATPEDMQPVFDALAASMNEKLGRTGACSVTCVEEARFILDLFDASGDRAIDGDELAGNEIVLGFLSADVDLYADYGTEDQEYWPRHDDVDDHVSFALLFHAVPIE